MVIFDQVNLMPTLSISGNKFLNLAPWYYCMDCKTMSRWSTWCWLTMQKVCQMILIKVQSGNVLTEIRSHPHLIFSKQFLFCKPKPLWGVKHYWHSTQILVWQNSIKSFMRPFGRAHCGQNPSKIRIQCAINLKPHISLQKEARSLLASLRPQCCTPWCLSPLLWCMHHAMPWQIATPTMDMINQPPPPLSTMSSRVPSVPWSQSYPPWTRRRAKCSRRAASLPPGRVIVRRDAL